LVRFLNDLPDSAQSARALEILKNIMEAEQSESFEALARQETSKGSNARLDGISSNVIPLRAVSFSDMKSHFGKVPEDLLDTLEAESLFLKAVLRQLPIGVLILDAPARNIILGNDKARRIWGMSQMPIEGAARYKRSRGFHLDGRIYQIDEWPSSRAALKGETVIDEEIEIIREDGVRAVTSQSSAPLRKSDGSIFGAVVTIQDVTEKKKDERILGFLSKLGSILGMSLDLKQQMIDLANLVVEHLDVDVCEIKIGKHYHSLGFTVHAGQLIQNINSSLTLTLELHDRDLGTIALFREQTGFDEKDLTVVRDLAKRVEMVVENSSLYQRAQQEIATRKQKEAELKRAVRARDEFLAIASHELRTPLTPLKSLIDVWSRQLNATDPNKFSQDQLKRIGDLASLQVSRFVRLVNDLLDVSRVQTGQLKLCFAFVDLNELVQTAVARQDAEYRGRGEGIVYIGSGPLIAQVDRVRIEQLVENLLTNAMKFGNGKLIHVTSKRIGEHSAEIQVKDEGIGIRLQDQDRIFRRFEKSAATQDQSAESHGGTIHVESESGKGSTFIVRIPLLQK
jgi:PAS domain S-box-containing protein